MRSEISDIMPHIAKPGEEPVKHSIVEVHEDTSQYREGMFFCEHEYKWIERSTSKGEAS